MKKIIIVGAHGTIGKLVAEILEQHNSVIRVGHSEGDYTIDLGQKASIEKMCDRVIPFDGIICTAGVSAFGKVTEASDEDYHMGQVNLVRTALHHINDNGSITITSGLLAREPWPGPAPTAMVNTALEGFVRAAALDAPKGIRINVVSPIFVTETAKKMGMDTICTMTALETAKAYLVSVDGGMNGTVLDVRDYGGVEGGES